MPFDDPRAPISETAYSSAFRLLTISRTDLFQREKPMNFFNNFNTRDATARLVENSLVDKPAVTGQQIADSIYLLAGAMGDDWNSASREAAAGMVLALLAKNSTLESYLNPRGWELVSALVRTEPQIAARLSPRARAEIDAYRRTERQVSMANAA